MGVILSRYTGTKRHLTTQRLGNTGYSPQHIWSINQSINQY